MLALPYRTENPTQRFPIVTVTLIVINTMVFLYELQLAGRGELQAALLAWAVVPGEASATPGPELALDFVRALFLHGGWLHLVGNMLFLYLFGKNIEDILGEVLFLVLYLAWGSLAHVVQIAITPNDPRPLIGASGAIAGVMGAYLMLFPQSYVRVWAWFLVFVRRYRLRAESVLGWWFLLQLLRGVLSLGATTSVAYAAHIGGFVGGLGLTWLLVATRNIWGRALR